MVYLLSALGILKHPVLVFHTVGYHPQCETPRGRVVATVHCWPPPCWMLGQVGFVYTGLLAAHGALFALCPNGLRRTHVGSTVPSLVEGGGAWIRPPDGKHILVTLN